MRFVVFLSLACAATVLGKSYTKCELASELENIHNMAREDVKKWVCIVQYESTFNTTAIGTRNSDGSKDHGLFQLSDKYWCDRPKDKGCGKPCSAFLDDDITDDVKCIRTIIRERESWKGAGTGLTAWVAYVNTCKPKNLDEYMAECWDTGISSNQISGANIRPAQQETAPGSQGHVPIINNARSPIRPKVISNMHPPHNVYPSYIHVPMQNGFVVPRPYHFFYQRNY